MRRTASFLAAVVFLIVTGCFHIVEYLGIGTERPPQTGDEIPGASIEAYPLESTALWQGNYAWIVARAIDRDGQRIAISLGDDGLQLLDNGITTELALGDMQARGLAFSNDGTRLAIVGRLNVAYERKVLSIRDLSLKELARFALPDVPSGPRVDGDQTFCVSWSGDDARVAVSTSSAVLRRLDWGDLGAITPLVFIVKLDDGSIIVDSYTDAYFLDSRTLAASEPPTRGEDSTAGRVRALHVTEEGTLRMGDPIRDADFVVDSNAARGVYVVLRQYSIGTLLSTSTDLVFLRDSAGHEAVAPSFSTNNYELPGRRDWYVRSD